MPIEVDEAQFAALQNTARLVQGMLKNPKTRMKVLSAYKEYDPNATVPEIDAISPIDARMSNLENVVMNFIQTTNESREKEKTESRLEQIRSEMESGRRMLKERGYTDEGIKKIEEFRDHKGLVDYADAIKLYEIDNPPPNVSDPGYSGMNLFDMVHAESNENEFWKRLHDSGGEDNAAVDAIVNQTIREMRGASPRR